MENERHIATAIIDWQGITLSVSYEADWLSMGWQGDRAVAHLQLQSITPERAPLPVTETGYRSHFIHPSEIDAAGGPVAFAIAWLDHASQDKAWRAVQINGRQLSLF